MTAVARAGRVTVIAVLTSYAAAFGLTLLVETPFWTAALVALRLARPPAAAALAVVVNVATHPALWWSLSLLQASSGTRIACEVMVCLAEWALALLLLRRDAALLVAVSLGANAASFLSGFFA
jgi:hypothetical protein